MYHYSFIYNMRFSNLYIMDLENAERWREHPLVEQSFQWTTSHDWPALAWLYDPSGPEKNASGHRITCLVRLICPSLPYKRTYIRVHMLRPKIFRAANCQRCLKALEVEKSLHLSFYEGCSISSSCFGIKEER